MGRVRLLLMMTGLGIVNGQTQVNLRTQSRDVDFSGASSTRPVKTGSALPAHCTLGDLFFNMAAAAGVNLYGCVALDTWAVESSGSGGSLTVKADGVVVGSPRPQINVIPGLGIGTGVTDTGTEINIQHFADTAVLTTKTVAQSGSLLLCSSASASSSAYTCTMSPTLGAYSMGLILSWVPDVSGSGGATTLNVDTLGAKSLKLADGVTDPASGDVVGGRMYSIWYDGTVFRLPLSPAIAGTGGETQPACAADQRGRLWFVLGATGVKDGLLVCSKSAADSYVWAVLY